MPILSTIMETPTFINPAGNIDRGARADDRAVPIRCGSRIYIRKAGRVVPADVAPRDVPMSDGALREKFVPKISEILKI